MNEKNWYYAAAGQQVGPYTADELKSMAESGKINGQTHVWKEGMGNWTPMAEIKELKASPTRMPNPLGPPPSQQEEEHHLKLGGSRKFDSVNQQDTDPKAGVSVQDMLVSPDSGKKQEPRIVQQSKVGFFESFGLGSFEAAFFAVTLIIGGIACAIMREYWHVIVMGLGCLWIFAASWALVVRAFIKHWGWGLAYIFIPFAALVYIIVDLKNAYKAIVLSLVGIAAIITPTRTSSFVESPVYEMYEEQQKVIEEWIEQQNQEMEQQRNEKLDQFDEEN